MASPKVSIIIPMYGVEKYIGNCLSSVMAQDYPDTEILIVNDCTKDRSLEIAETIIGAYTGPLQFRILSHEHNRGLAGARNTGINAATGEYLFFLDGDDELLPGAIRVLVGAIADTQCDVITANRKAIDWETRKAYKLIEADYSAGRADTIKGLLDNQIHGTAWNKLINREFLIRNDLFFKEGVIYEDDLWMYKFLCARPAVCFLPEFTYIYYVRPGSLLQTFGARHMLSKIAITAAAAIDLPTFNGEILLYALKAVENFRQGALVSAVTHLENRRDYNRIYRLMRQLRIDRKAYMNIPDLSWAAKLRFLNNYMPEALGAWWNRLFIKVMLKRWSYKLTYMKDEKLTLTTDFWEKAQKVLNP